MTEEPNLPGWYIDSGDTTAERFWNGETWTDLTRPAPTLDDYLGSIEPLLLSILREQEPEPLIADPQSVEDVWTIYSSNNADEKINFVIQPS